LPYGGGGKLGEGSHDEVGVGVARVCSSRQGASDWLEKKKKKIFFVRLNKFKNATGPTSAIQRGERGKKRKKGKQHPSHKKTLRNKSGGKTTLSIRRVWDEELQETALKLDSQWRTNPRPKDLSKNKEGQKGIHRHNNKRRVNRYKEQNKAGPVPVLR